MEEDTVVIVLRKGKQDGGNDRIVAIKYQKRYGLRWDTNNN